MDTFFNRIESVKYKKNDENIIDYTKGIVSDGEDVVIYQDDGHKVTKIHVPIDSINSYVDIFNHGIKDHKMDLMNRLVNDFDLQSDDIQTSFNSMLHHPNDYELANSSQDNLNSATSRFFKRILNLDDPALAGKNISVSATFKPRNKTAKKSRKGEMLALKKQKTAKKRRKKRS
tara:strand:+ start:493 stop:1014 length:522 start_codon:yes stop_codon:yes gene_type:complete